MNERNSCNDADSEGIKSFEQKISKTGGRNFCNYAALRFPVCTSFCLSVIMDLLFIFFSLCLFSSRVSLSRVSIAFANSISSANHFLCTLSRLSSICDRINYGNAVYAGLSFTNACKLQAFLNAAARLLWDLIEFPHISSFILLRPMFPQIFQSLCVHKISFV